MKVHDQTINLRALEGFHLFKFMDDAGRERLLEAATFVSYAPHQIIMREGDPGEALYMIQQGDVRVYTVRDGEEIELAMLGAGACFGEVALLTAEPRTATVMTRTECTLICFPKNQIAEILDAYPKVKKLLLSVIRGRAQGTIDKLNQNP